MLWRISNIQHVLRISWRLTKHITLNHVHFSLVIECTSNTYSSRRFTSTSSCLSTRQDGWHALNWVQHCDSPASVRWRRSVGVGSRAPLEWIAIALSSHQTHRRYLWALRSRHSRSVIRDSRHCRHRYQDWKFIATITSGNSLTVFPLFIHSRFHLYIHSPLCHFSYISKWRIPGYVM